MGKKLFVSNELLRLYGCRSCVWKGSPLCPRGFSLPGESTDVGFCSELAEFFLSFAGPEDSLSAVREKFVLYQRELQASDDRARYLALVGRISDEERGAADPVVLGRLRAEAAVLRLWWDGLHESVLKGLGRVVDREVRSRDVVRSGSGKISIQQLNVLLKGGDGKLVSGGVVKGEGE